MPRVVEEFIYPAMEDFRIDIVLGEGLNARTMLDPAEAVHADRCHHPQRHALRPDARPLPHARASGVLPREELAEIVRVNAIKLNTELEPAAAEELAKRSRGTPRIANSRLHWVRSFAASEADGDITLKVARTALELAEVDAKGWTSKIAVIWKRSSGCSKAARPASKPLPRP